MRKNWLDNIRWITILLVLIYHLFYIFNAEGVFGGIGPFEEVQYQDALMYMLYPWFMVLLFVVAGISSRYALEKQSLKEFSKSRTRKLLVPSTIGLFVFQWMTGYFNTLAAGAMETVPSFIRYFVFAISGIGPLWFIQDLWLFSIILILIKTADRNDRFYKICSKTNPLVTVLLFLPLWGMSQFYGNPSVNPAYGLINLYRPHYYFVAFLIGYFVLSHEEVTDKLLKFRLPLLIVSAAGLIIYTIVCFGEDYTLPEHLSQIYVVALAWVTVLAVIANGKYYLNKTSVFATYMTRNSFGLYIVHYLVLIATAWTLTTKTTLPSWAIYIICFVVMSAGSVVLNEILKRMPFVRWAVLGIKK